MNNKSLGLWAAVLLLVGGLVHMIPALYSGLAGLTGGFPWIQVVVGILSVVVALVVFAGDKQAEEKMGGGDKMGDPHAGSDGMGGSSRENM